MWLAWSEMVDVYLGQGLAMLRLAKTETVVLRLPPTLPLERVLAKLADSLPPAQTSGKSTKSTVTTRRKLRISLSAVLCPPIAYSAPPEVKRWDERQKIANATAAYSMDVSVEQLRCEIAPLRCGIAAALPATFISEVEHWASQQQMRLHSVRPLWATATQCATARQPEVQGLLLQEPDAWTLLSDNGQGMLHAATLAMSSDPSVVQTDLRRWLVSANLSEDKLLRLRFTPQLNALIPRGPALWAPHWSSP